MQHLQNFFDSLTEQAKELAPVAYRTMSTSDIEARPTIRYAESVRYHSDGYHCFGYNKPISRIFGPQQRGDDRTGEAALSHPPTIDHRHSDQDIFILFSCCVPVVGSRRSLLCDLQRGVTQLIPNGLAEILKQHRGKSITNIKTAYDNKYDSQIDGYFNFLIDREFGFYCDDIEAFPEIDLRWDEPERISNALIDIDSDSNHNFNSILADLDDLGCKALQVRYYSGGRLSQVRELLVAAHGTCLRAIELVVPFHIDETPQGYQKLCEEFPRISKIFVHSSPDNRFVQTEQTGVPLVYRSSIIGSPNCCGEVHPSYFVAEIKSFTEAQSYNTCLNRKISIDSRGEIRNCPSLPRSFGNVRDTSLHEALAQRDFTALWMINKDQIEICRDCEFRYVCTDCRAYLTQPADRFSKPSKCTYDPYTAQWY